MVETEGYRSKVRTASQFQSLSITPPDPDL
jgi:hypothetical protein